jgi:hypothetical protein
MENNLDINQWQSQVNLAYLDIQESHLQDK